MSMPGYGKYGGAEFVGGGAIGGGGSLTPGRTVGLEYSTGSGDEFGFHRVNEYRRGRGGTIGEEGRFGSTAGTSGGKSTKN